MYDNNNVFAKMIRGEIPTNKVYENDFAMSFHDINPMYPFCQDFLENIYKKNGKICYHEKCVYKRYASTHNCRTP